MLDFDLDDFLRTYKPKTIEKSLEPYTNCPKLKSYIFLKQTNRDKLECDGTYIRYIKINDAFLDKKYPNHIRPGGFLIDGGFMKYGTFTPSPCKDQWTHLQLKYRFKDKDEDGNNIDKTRVFVINMSTNYIFFRVFNPSDRAEMIELMGNL
jgi:hypothetical protein